ncbi:MAG: diguanylate cyclase (GGDEF)-like protein [Halieaceae bacterium]|jgi:diguanylate cyclase (GGDEF)-like protein
MTPSRSPNLDNLRLAQLAEMGDFYVPTEARFSRITKIACQIFDVPIARITLISPADEPMVASTIRNPRDPGFCDYAVLRENQLVILDARLNPEFASDPEVVGRPFVRFYAGQLLRHEGKKVGSLSIIDQDARGFSPADCETLASLGAWVENEIRLTALGLAQHELLQQLDEAERAKLIDELTQQWNRQGLEQLAPIELDRAVRQGSQLTVMAVKVENYEKLRAYHSNELADEVLREVCGRIVVGVRPQDIVCRDAKDHFVILLGDCSQETAVIVADRVMSKVHAEPVVAGGIDVRASIGIGSVSSLSHKSLQFEDLIEVANDALLEAGQLGPGQVRLRHF